MPGLGLSLPDVALRSRGDPAPPSAPPAAINSIVIEGDSITYFAGDAQRYAGRFAAHRPGKTITVNADNSRTVGGVAWAGPPAEGADTGTGGANTSASLNTLLAQRPTDLASGAQLVTALIGTNDLQAYSVANFRSRLATWAAGLRSGGVKVGYSVPPSLNSGQQYAGYTAFMAKRATLIADARDPAVWGLFADFYIPMGEQPDLNAADNSAYISTDGVHPNAAGHAKLYQPFRAAVDTIIDATRATATTMINAAWLASETNLNTAETLTRRFVVEGIAHGGLALTGSNALSVSGAAGSPLISLNGRTPAASFTGWLYNGDTVDLTLTTASGNSAARTVDLKVGTETRTLSYTTGAAVTPVAYVHGDTEWAQVEAGSFSWTRTFAASGIALIAVRTDGTITGLTVGGNAATKLFRQADDYGALDVWAVAVTAGSRAIVVTWGGYRGAAAMSWGVVTGADATPTQVDYSAPASESSPHLTGSLSVPASGLAIAFFAEGGGASITAATTNTGTTFADEGNGAYQGGTAGIAVGKRTTTGTASFNFAFGTWSRGAVVLKAAGT